MKHVIATAVLLLIIATAFAQPTGKISGSAVHEGKPAEGTTVQLLRANDSGTVKLSAVNKEGAFAFEELPNGKYVVLYTAVGYRKALSKPVELNTEQQSAALPPMDLTPLPKSLSEVTVTARRPLVEQRIDRTIVNVDAAITNVGASALEVLEKAPGVSVDREGNISLKGKDGVLVIVDGRPTQLGGQDLANLLRNMNANGLDQIEIMTNPPARYDAAGNAGIINIKTKKIIKAGLNGSASLNYTQGRYPKTAEGFNFNYREGKVNLFANLGHNYQKRFTTMYIDRTVFNDNTGAAENVFSQTSNRLGEGHAYNAKFGIDFFATQKTTIGAALNANARNLRADNLSTTNIFSAAKELQSVTNAMVYNQTDWTSTNANANFRTVLDKAGKELTADVEYAEHSMSNDLFMVNGFTDAAGNPYRKADTLTGLLPQRIEVYSARLDYLHPLKAGARFEAGLKSSTVTTDNNAVYDSIQYGRIVRDVNRSNHFVYAETINAAYANLSTPLSKKLSLQFGLRLENTVAKGNQKTTGQTFSRQYTQLFPTAFLQYKASENHVFGANLGRRVSRPSYQSLNPFIRFIDRYTFSQGNPALRPSVSNTVELSHSWKNMITSTVNYTHVADVIQEIIQPNGQDVFNRPANVSSLVQIGIAVNAATPLTKWWTSNVNVNVYRDRYKGFVGTAPIDRSATSFIFNFTEQFKVTKTLAAEINGRYRNGWLEGIMRVKPVGFVGAGISQQVWKNKGNLRLSVRDIFWTQRLNGRTQYGNVDVLMKQVSETRVVTLGFTYSFSKGKKVALVKRTAGSSAEEQGRIGQ